MAFLFFIISFVLSFFLTRHIIPRMKQWGIVDEPKHAERKIHTKAIPLGGGLAVFVSVLVAMIVAYSVHVIGDDITLRRLIGIACGGGILMIGGLMDDKYNLSPGKQILFPIVASLVALVSGIGIESISSPSGGVFSLQQFQIDINGIGNWVILADMIVFFWLMGMMYTTKFLDGLDGLVTGVVGVGALMIYVLTEQTLWYQPEVGVVALILAGACAGFLVFNFHPAKIFLGEGGSLFTGYMLGILAIISGSKIATTLLVMGIPMLDVARVIFIRLKNNRPLFRGDAEHLHFRLMHSGLGHRQTVLLLYAVSFLFGMTTLFLQSHQKLIALSFLLVLMILIGVVLSKKNIETRGSSEK